MKILTALIPVIALTSCAAMRLPDEQTAPARFHGEWNRVLADCGTANNDSLIVITATRIDFYESAGDIRSAALNGPNELLIVADVSDAEETSITEYRFTLSDDGQSLTYIDETDEPFVRHRCPASRTLSPG